ncbi:MaoC family dehydratase [soil metagenome]
MGLTIDQLSIGQSAAKAHVVTDADLRAFADVSGDHNPVHLDEAFAATTPFKGRIAHGMLSGAYISALIAGELPGSGTIYLSQQMSFRRPVRIGDEVVTTATVTAIDAEKGRVTLATVCTVNSKPVVEGEAVVMPPKAEAA